MFCPHLFDSYVEEKDLLLGKISRLSCCCLDAFSVCYFIHIAQQNADSKSDKQTFNLKSNCMCRVTTTHYLIQLELSQCCYSFFIAFLIVINISERIFFIIGSKRSSASTFR